MFRPLLACCGSGHWRSCQEAANIKKNLYNLTDVATRARRGGISVLVECFDQEKGVLTKRPSLGAQKEPRFVLGQWAGFMITRSSRRSLYWILESFRSYADRRNPRAQVMEKNVIAVGDCRDGYTAILRDDDVAGVR